jgi:hypothetical protein
MYVKLDANSDAWMSTTPVIADEVTNLGQIDVDGVYNLKPVGAATATPAVVRTVDGVIWAKIAHSSEGQFPQDTNAVQDVSTVTIGASAKLSDAVIDSFAPERKMYRFTGGQSTLKLYIETKAPFKGDANYYGMTSVRPYYAQESDKYADTSSISEQFMQTSQSTLDSGYMGLSSMGIDTANCDRYMMETDFELRTGTSCHGSRKIRDSAIWLRLEGASSAWLQYPVVQSLQDVNQTGVYQLQPNAWTGMPIFAYVEKRSDGLWAKIHQQYKNDYVPNADSFGDIASAQVKEEAKLSDDAINAIAPGTKVYRFQTSQAGSNYFYVKTRVNYEDRARGFGITASQYWAKRGSSYSDSGWQQKNRNTNLDSNNVDGDNGCARIMIDTEGSSLNGWSCRWHDYYRHYTTSKRCFSHGYYCNSGSGHRHGKAHISQMYVKLDVNSDAWSG